MTDLTICAKCRHYAPAIYKWHNGPVLIDVPARCWHPTKGPCFNYVTGDPGWIEADDCFQKNHGACSEYDAIPSELPFTIVQDAPRKHWWQK